MSFKDSLGEDADLANLTKVEHPTVPQTGRKPLSAASRSFNERNHERAETEAGVSAFGRKPKNERGHKREQSEFQQLLAQALRALARREHSTVELKRKLHGYLDQASEQAVNQIIEALVLDGSLSDERFAAEFVRSRIQKGYGPIRIRMDLLERGIPDRLAEAELTRPTEFWQQQAADVCLRKFGRARGQDQTQDLANDLSEGGGPATLESLRAISLPARVPGGSDLPHPRWPATRLGFCNPKSRCAC